MSDVHKVIPRKVWTEELKKVFLPTFTKHMFVEKQHLMKRNPCQQLTIEADLLCFAFKQHGKHGSAWVDGNTSKFWNQM